jgi:Mo-co oxidoreductase dimerisation domain
VEVSVDGGEHWEEAALEPPVSRYAWARWTFDWNPAAGSTYEVCSRAYDSDGNVQPRSSPWNLCNVAVNEYHCCRVEVLAEGVLETGAGEIETVEHVEKETDQQEQ